MSRPLGAGIVGVGFAGAAHAEALRRSGAADVVAIAAGGASSARAAAARLGVPAAYGDWRELVADERVDVVHVCTPNALHVPVALAALAAGRHVICEKPLAETVAAASRLVEAARAAEGLITALCHNYRRYPMVARARELVAAGAIGAVHAVHGVYLQDWLCADSVHNWRLDPGAGGESVTFADIGSHWCDLASFVSGRRIEAVCAVTSSRHGRAGEDHAGVLLRLGGGVLGTVVASQVAPGAKNRLRIRLDGATGSLEWEQERPDELSLGRFEGPSELHAKAALELGERSRPLVSLPPGHAEGWTATFANLFSAVYRRIAGAAIAGDEDVATLADGLELMRVIEAVRASGAGGGWIELRA